MAHYFPSGPLRFEIIFFFFFLFFVFDIPGKKSAHARVAVIDPVMAVRILLCQASFLI